MLESQRIDLLTSMGVKSFLPRFELGAAKPSKVLSPLTEAKPLESAHSPIAQNTAVQSAGTLVEQAARILQQQQMQSVAGQLSDEKTKAATPQSEGMPKLAEIGSSSPSTETIAATAENPAVVEKPLRFRQRLLRCAEFLMLIDQPALQWQEERQAKQFFDELYYAFYRKRSEFFATEVFEWPPAKNFPKAHDINAARATFNGYLQAKIKSPECLFIICWGEAAANNFIDVEFEAGKLIEYQGRKVLFAHELSRYWKQPNNKKSLWLDLQKLKHSVNSH